MIQKMPVKTLPMRDIAKAVKEDLKWRYSAAGHPNSVLQGRSAMYHRDDFFLTRRD
ncbi:hypothetical protein KCP75_02445 [Salmonella enterica subsp. enterica]|nr:hypothetical protein KCP75_02445 [Salmonella enterica subsp. enterica]